LCCYPAISTETLSLGSNFTLDMKLTSHVNYQQFADHVLFRRCLICVGDLDFENGQHLPWVETNISKLIRVCQALCSISSNTPCEQPQVE
jgi:hypothetical protein